jgi:SAM-dependent methyltransferase
MGVCDEYEYPIESDEYDVVLAGQVLEHVKLPWLWLPELVRVAKPWGLVALIAPAQEAYHEHPVDCWRIWPDGMRALMEHAGLQVELIARQEWRRDRQTWGIDTIGIGRKV